MNPHVRTRKGQSAIEYLTTYGWALLAILVVGAFLVQFGIFDQCQPSDPDFGPQDVVVTGWGFTGTSSMQMTLQAIGNDVNVTDVSLDDASGASFDDGDGNSWQNITSGKEATVTLSSLGTTSDECFNSHVQITYDVDEDGGISGAMISSNRPLQGRAP